MNKIVELEQNVQKFLEDVTATNLCGKTIATHTSVCYNIGKKVYFRSKQIVVMYENSNQLNITHIATNNLNFL